MSNTFYFKMDGLDKLLTQFSALPNNVQSELAAELKVAATEIKNQAQGDAPVDESRLKSALSVNQLGKTQFEVVAQASHSGYIEFGTKSNTVIPAGLESVANSIKGPGDNGSVSPLDAIEGWVKRKGLAATYSVKTRRRTRVKSEANLTKQIAFLIYRKIMKVGIKPHPYFFKQIAPVEHRLRQRVVNMLQQLIS